MLLVNTSCAALELTNMVYFLEMATLIMFKGSPVWLLHTLLAECACILSCCPFPFRFCFCGDVFSYLLCVSGGMYGMPPLMDRYGLAVPMAHPGMVCANHYPYFRFLTCFVFCKDP